MGLGTRPTTWTLGRSAAILIGAGGPWRATALGLLLGFGAVIALDPPLFDPDETLFAIVVERMRSTGDLIIPSWEGKAFLDRPAPWYWMPLASTALLGSTPLAFRVPSLLLGLMTVLATIGLARRLARGEGRAETSADSNGPSALSGLVLTAMPGFWIATVAVGHDGALVAFVTAAAWALVGRRGDGRLESFGAVAVAGLLLAGGLAAKGPLGIILPQMTLTALVVVRRTLPPWRPILCSIAIGLIVASPWYALAELREPGYLRQFLIGRHLGGYLTRDQRHGDRSILEPIIMLAGGTLATLPLVLAGLAAGLPPTARALLRRRPFPSDARSGGPVSTASPREAIAPGDLGSPTGRAPSLGGELRHDAPGQALRTSALAAVLMAGFFLSAGSRNPTYLLPVFPLLAIVAASVVAQCGPSSSENDDAVYMPPLTRRRPWPLPTVHTLVIGVPVMLALSVAALAPLLPGMIAERSAEPVKRWLDEQPAGNWRHGWFDDLPPSALLRMPDANWRRVSWEEIEQPPPEAIRLVIRDTRVGRIGYTPWARLGRIIDLPGRYSVLVVEPPR
jgi:4-amino-4-deoxy-L-arabinose transferase-like glycosyltransferase